MDDGYAWLFPWWVGNDEMESVTSDVTEVPLNRIVWGLENFR
jgi:hypothetical protein